MIELFLACALSLRPLSLPEAPEADYVILRRWLEARYPNLDVVFVNEDEALLDKGAERTPLSIPVAQAFKAEGLRLWTKPKQRHLTKAA